MKTLNTRIAEALGYRAVEIEEPKKGDILSMGAVYTHHVIDPNGEPVPWSEHKPDGRDIGLIFGMPCWESDLGAAMKLCKDSGLHLTIDMDLLGGLHIEVWDDIANGGAFEGDFQFVPDEIMRGNRLANAILEAWLQWHNDANS